MVLWEMTSYGSLPLPGLSVNDVVNKATNAELQHPRWATQTTANYCYVDSVAASCCRLHVLQTVAVYSEGTKLHSWPGFSCGCHHVLCLATFGGTSPSKIAQLKVKIP